MTESTKIDFRHRRVAEIEDIADLVEMLFPGNRNQQHAAARILLALKAADEPVPSLSHLEQQWRISRRTLQRTRAKLSRLGLIERLTWMNARCNGQEGWKLSGRFCTALRGLADRVDELRKDTRPERSRKDAAMADLLRP